MVKNVAMVTLVVLALYIMGVYTAYHQIQKWTDHKIEKEDEYHTLFILSLLSWVVYPLYGLIYIFRKCEED